MTAATLPADGLPEAVAQLLSRVVLRDTSAFQRLYQLVASRLLAVAVRVVQDRALAEDVLQEVFVHLWNRPQTGAPGQALSLSWLCVVTRNRAIDALRKRRPETPLHWRDADGEEQVHDAAAEGGSPLELLLAEEDGSRLGHCMGQIDSEPRSALLLVYYEGLTHAELAQRLARPLGTVKAWMRRSLARLRDCMEACT